MVVAQARRSVLLVSVVLGESSLPAYQGLSLTNLNSHFGVMFAKALGADKVVGISRKADKKNDVMKMGADEYVATDDDPEWATNNARSLDLIICTVSSPKMPLTGYLGMLKTKGTMIQVGAPEDYLPQTQAFPYIMKGIKFGGSAIGPPWQIEEVCT